MSTKLTSWSKRPWSRWLGMWWIPEDPDGGLSAPWLVPRSRAAGRQSPPVREKRTPQPSQPAVDAQPASPRSGQLDRTRHKRGCNFGRSLPEMTRGLVGPLSAPRPSPGSTLLHPTRIAGRLLAWPSGYWTSAGRIAVAYEARDGDLTQEEGRDLKGTRSRPSPVPPSQRGSVDLAPNAGTGTAFPLSAKHRHCRFRNPSA